MLISHILISIKKIRANEWWIDCISIYWAYVVFTAPYRMTQPIIPFRSGQSWAGQATGSHLDAGYCTASFSNSKRGRNGEGQGSNNEICEAAFPLLHCDFYSASRRREGTQPVCNSKPTRCARAAPHVGWVIYYSDLLRTSCDIHETMARSSVSHPVYLSRSPHVVTAVTDVSPRVTINTSQHGGDRLLLSCGHVMETII